LTWRSKTWPGSSSRQRRCVSKSPSRGLGFERLRRRACLGGSAGTCTCNAGTRMVALSLLAPCARADSACSVPKPEK
jgi:hypothetical protein